MWNDREIVVEAAGLMFYGPNIPDLYRRAADYVDKILRGAKPADIPVEQPTKFDLVINLITAKALGLDVPPAIIRRVADDSVEIEEAEGWEPLTYEIDRAWFENATAG
jgi:putative ABC transport system substrate-binding protein